MRAEKLFKFKNASVIYMALKSATGVSDAVWQG